MPDTTTPPPSPTYRVQEGDVISVETKSPFASTAIYGLVVLLITAAVKKWVPPVFQDPSVKALLELLGYGIGAAMVLYGRWRATRPLGLTPVKTVTVKLLFLSLLVLPGCNAVGLMPKAEHDAQMALIRRAEGNEYMDWAAAIAKRPDAKPLPDLSAYTPGQRDAWYDVKLKRRQELDAALNGTPTSAPTTQP